MLITRYMEADPTQRIVAHVFEPHANGDVVIEDETLGRAILKTRNEPGDVWDPPRELTAYVDYSSWVATIEPDGFTFEERT